jgi:hypothetical protein
MVAGVQDTSTKIVLVAPTRESPHDDIRTIPRPIIISTKRVIILRSGESGINSESCYYRHQCRKRNEIRSGSCCYEAVVAVTAMVVGVGGIIRRSSQFYCGVTGHGSGTRPVPAKVWNGLKTENFQIVKTVSVGYAFSA